MEREHKCICKRERESKRDSKGERWSESVNERDSKCVCLRVRER